MCHRSHQLRTSLCALAFVASVGCSAAPLNDDWDTRGRSAQFDATDTAPEGVIEIQLGSSFESDDAIELSTAVNYGVTDAVEASAALSIHHDGRRDGEHGVGDLAVGLKNRWIEGGGPRPAFATELGLSLPTGDQDLSSQGVDPTFAALATSVFGRTTVTGRYELSLPSAGDDPGRDTTHYVAFSAANAFRPRIAVFGTGDASWAEDGEVASTAGLGVAISLSRSVLLDAAIAFGMSGDVPDSDLLVTLSARF